MKPFPLTLAMVLLAISICAPPLLAQNFTWTQTSAPMEDWTSIALSADGTKLAAVVYGGGIYTSTSSGATWTLTSAPLLGWYCIASSDGTKLAAGVGGGGNSGGIYTSTNSGATWVLANAPTDEWASIVSASSGTELAAVAYGGGIYSALPPPSTTNQPTAQTIIVAPRMLSNGQFQFSFDTTNGFDYAVQYSANLT